MQLNAYTVYDIKAGAYTTPFFLPNDATAKRTFVNCVGDKGHAFGRNPEDYALCYLGQFDVNNGLFSTETPRPICTGLHAVTLLTASGVPNESINSAG